MVLIVMIIERKLLLAIGRVIGVIEVEHNRGWGRCVTGNKVVDQGPRQPREIFAVDLVLQAREGRSTGQIVGRIQGRPLHPEFEQGISAETIGVIGVCIPRGELIDALGSQVP